MSQAQENIQLTQHGSPIIIDPPESPDNASTSHELRPVTQRRQILILLSSFLTICITIGFNQSYGVFQSYYTSSEQDMLPPDAQSQSALIAFVGTLGAGLTWGGSIVVNPLMARVKDVRYLTVGGVLCMSAGFGLASLSTQVRYWDFYYVDRIYYKLFVWLVIQRFFLSSLSTLVFLLANDVYIFV
jgi:drug/metabolite transporter (DMT)-like permease